ncbi:hypothetical protein SLEP1_g994 [Rubroshorea leprosula]|uniref:Uncharacterized protein n=1 Tax=Rubroshorea leprosula TaxID=152421 RepID=A0AAV5HL49_9ROSI|nr:hypothetical protein SLEP1_g994 [Rubroshorea leprosula]
MYSSRSWSLLYADLLSPIHQTEASLYLLLICSLPSADLLSRKLLYFMLICSHGSYSHGSCSLLCCLLICSHWKSETTFCLSTFFRFIGPDFCWFSLTNAGL